MRVAAFADQDASRTAVAGICARAAAELLHVIDTFTGDPGTDEYRAFRSALAPELVALLQADVVGPLLSGLTLDGEGRATVSDLPLRTYEAQDEIDPLLGRLSWLVAEVPSMADFYGQLHPGERERVDALVDDAHRLDLEKEADRERATAIVADLEVFHLWAHPGGRVVRKDPVAVEAFRREVAGWAALVLAADEEAKHRRDVIEGRAEPRDPEAAAIACREELAALEWEIEGAERALTELVERRRQVATVAAALPKPKTAGRCEHCDGPLAATPKGPVCYGCPSP